MPEGWAWCRIKDISSYIGDGDWIESKDQSENGIRLIQTGNIGLGSFKNKEGKYHFISEDTFNKLGCNEIFEGDILISRLPVSFFSIISIVYLNKKKAPNKGCSYHPR